MGEVQLQEAAIDTGPRKEQRRDEVEPAIKAERRIAELLRPPEQTAKEMQGIVMRAGEKLLKEHPHPEMKRIIETTAGVYLWEQMASPYTAEHSLPLGLTTHVSSKDKIETIEFDARFLSRAEYMYVIEAFREAGVIDEINGLQRGQLEDKQADLKDAVRDYLDHAPVTDLLETFRVKSESAASPARTLRDLTVTEEERERARLESEFQAMIDPQTQHDPTVQQARRLAVDKPLAMATVPDTTNAQTAHTKSTEFSRTQFRQYLHEAYLKKAAGLTTEQIEHVHVDSENMGQFYLQTPDGERGGDQGAFFNFTVDQLRPFNNTLYNAPGEYSRIAAAYTFSHLYDRTDTRDADTIISAGFDQAADVIAQQMIHRRYNTLDQIYENQRDYPYQLDNALWLNAVTGPTHDGSQPFVETIYGTSAPFGDTVVRGEIPSAYHLSEYKVGEISHSASGVIIDVPRLIRNEYRDKELPTEPSHSTDLVLTATSSYLASRAGTGFPDKWDPSIEGMKLVARNGETCYFVRDADHDPYKPNDTEISYIQRRNAADFCKELGMQGLADQIDSFDTLTIGQMVNLMREHVQYVVPEQDEQYKVDSGESWKKFINDDGKLEGQSKLFAHFAAKIFTTMYRHNVNLSGRIRPIDGFALDDAQKVTENRHWQTQISLPGEDKEFIIDISPPPAKLRTLAESTPKIPPQRDETPFHYDYQRTYEFIDTRQTLDMLPAAEFKDLLKESVGKITFAEPEVFEETKMRLFSKVPRSEQLPTLNNLPQEIEESVVLGIKTQGAELADADHDPAIAGMKLVARDGDQYFYTIDPESTEYKPVTEPIPTQMQNELAITCLRLKMTGLAEEIQTAEDLTFEKLRQTVRRYCRYTVTEDGQEAFKADHIMDLVNNVDADGILGGQCATFEFFWRKMADIVDGTRVNKPEGGYVLRNTTKISSMTHAQTRRESGDGKSSLIDVSPLRYNIPNFDEKPLLDNVVDNDPPIVRTLDDEAIEEIIGDIRRGNGWTKEYRTKKTEAPIVDLDDDSAARLTNALLESLKTDDPGVEESEPGDRVPEEPVEDAPIAEKPGVEDQVAEEPEAEQPGIVRKTLNKLRRRMHKPVTETVGSGTSKAEKKAAKTKREKRDAEKKEQSSEISVQAEEYKIDAPVTAPPAQIVEDTELSIPIAAVPEPEDTERVTHAQELNAIHSTNEAFLMGLTSYLGLKQGSEHNREFLDYALVTSMSKLALRDSKLAGRNLHMQVLSLVDKFYQLEEGSLVETDFSNIGRTLNRLQGIVRMYKDRPEGFVKLLQQRTFPSYDRRFLGIMERTINAYTDWDITRPKNVVSYPELDLPELLDADYNKLFADSSTTFAEVPVGEKNPQTESSDQHPERDMLQESAYQESFSPGSTATFEPQAATPKKKRTEPKTTADGDRLLEDADYLDQFKPPTNK